MTESHDMTTEGQGATSRLDTAAAQDPAGIASRSHAERQRQRFSRLADSGLSVYEARAEARKVDAINDDDRAEAKREGSELAAKIARRRFRF